jgi:hypothetical protein
MIGWGGGDVRLGGRDRKAVSAVERARLSVTRAIRSSIDNADQYHPELARHLSRHSLEQRRRPPCAQCTPPHESVINGGSAARLARERSRRVCPADP